ARLTVLDPASLLLVLVQPLDQLLTFVLDICQKPFHSVLEALLFAVLRVNAGHGGKAAMEREERTGEGAIDVLLAHGGLQLPLHIGHRGAHLVHACSGLLPSAVIGGHGLFGASGLRAALVKGCLVRSLSLSIRLLALVDRCFWWLGRLFQILSGGLPDQPDRQ